MWCDRRGMAVPASLRPPCATIALWPRSPAPRESHPADDTPGGPPPPLSPRPATKLHKPTNSNQLQPRLPSLPGIQLSSGGERAHAREGLDAPPRATRPALCSRTRPAASACAQEPPPLGVTALHTSRTTPRRARRPLSTAPLYFPPSLPSRGCFALLPQGRTHASRLRGRAPLASIGPKLAEARGRRH